jgi:hypothetical protein
LIFQPRLFQQFFRAGFAAEWILSFVVCHDSRLSFNITITRLAVQMLAESGDGNAGSVV